MGKGKFNFNETPVAKVSEEIRESRVEQTIQPEPQSAPTAPHQVQPVAQPIAEPQSSAPVKPKKTENGIVINVPMQDYMQLTMMKLQTGRTLKDLALQAIHEFVERNRVG